MPFVDLMAVHSSSGVSSGSSGLVSAGISPEKAATQLSAAPKVVSDRKILPSAHWRHVRGTSATMIQPALDHHYVVRHLGSAELIKRHLDGESICQVVENGSLTIVPAGSAFKWVATEPIDFAHLYISTALLARTASRMGRSSATLLDQVGCRDPLLESLYSEMLGEDHFPNQPETLYVNSLLEAFLMRLVHRHSAVNVGAAPKRETLAKHRLRRVKDFVEERLHAVVTLTDLAYIAGGSVYHFSRAFKNAVGESPYNYLLRRRTERAKVLLSTSDLPLADIAIACGFRGTLHLSRTFSRLTGINPSRFRREEAAPQAYAE